MKERDSGGFAIIDENLRERARKIAESEPFEVSQQTRNNPERLIEELRLQRIELELQNEELLRVYEQLASSNERFSNLYFQAPVGYLTLDRSGIIEEANLLAANLLREPREDLIGRPFTAFVTPHSRDPLHRHLEQVYAVDEMVSCEVAIEPGDDGRRELELQSIAVTAAGDDQPHCRTALFDITARKETERERALLDQQLLQAHKMEALGRLAGGIAHDFNNLLTLIIGYSKLALNNMKSDDPFYNHISHINKAGNHAAELIDQLLSFSRNHTVAPAIVNLNQLIREMETMIGRVTGDNVTLDILLAEDLGHVRVDPSQMTQIMLNLVVNAQEAMPLGGAITISTHNLELDGPRARALNLSAGSYVALEVRDTGNGMDPDTLARVFEPFFTTKRGQKGHGLGLATTYGIVVQSGGMIEVNSERGEGTRFNLYFPRLDADTGQLVRPPADPRPRPTTARETILVVDDQDDLRDFAALVLGKYQYDIINAQTPEQAVAICKQRGAPIQLVLTDVSMPNLNGPEMVKILKRLHPDMRVLFMSGHPREVVCRDHDIAPDSYFLEKPFTPEQLAHMVRVALAG